MFSGHVLKKLLVLSSFKNENKIGHFQQNHVHNQVVIKKENRQEESSKQFTLKYTAATKALMPGFVVSKLLVTPVTSTSKDSFAETQPRWVPLANVLSHVATKISSNLGRNVMLSRLTFGWNGAHLQVSLIKGLCKGSSSNYHWKLCDYHMCCLKHNLQFIN